MLRESLKEYTRGRMPVDWATMQNHLGNALIALGDRESGTARLEQAISTYREALRELTRERAPLPRTVLQVDLGNAMEMLGERKSGTAR